jgi:DNA-binding SARP family transcriptional activator/tetratricopeptide (TPR) repeat protein
MVAHRPQNDLNLLREGALAPFEARLLGEVGIWQGGVRMGTSTRKQLALLAYLIANGGRVFPRDHVARLLWPQASQSRARQSLSQALYNLRQSHPHLPIAVGREMLCAPDEAFTSDLRVLENALAAEDVMAIISADRGSFMEGFSLRDSSEYDDWQEAVRTRLEGLTSTKLTHAAHEARARGSWQQVEQICEHLMQRSTADGELAHLFVQALLAQSKSHVAAVFLRKLQAQADAPENGVLLSEQVRREFQDLIRTSRSDNVNHLPFVGRADELVGLRSSYAHSVAGTTQLCVVDGDPGIGKTRLCEHFLRYCAIKGARVFLARCHSGEETLAFGPWARAMEAAVRPADLQELPQQWHRPLCAVLRATGAVWNETADDMATLPERRMYVFEAVSQLLLSVAGRGPVVLFFDDFQWASDSTSALLDYVLRRLDEHSLLVVLAIRAPRVSPHPLDSIRHTPSVHFHLRPLSAAESEALVVACESSQPVALPATLRQDVIRLAGGLPLYLLEYLRAVGHGMPQGVVGAFVPPTLEELISRRLAELPPSAVEILEVASVAGPSAPERVLRGAVEMQRRDFVGGVEVLCRHGLLHEQNEDLQFSHEVVREACYARMTVTRRRFYHAKVAEAYLSLGNRLDLDSVSRHYHASGERKLAFRYAMKAAKTSMAHGGIAEAKRQYIFACKAAESRAEKRAAQDQLSELLVALGATTEALPILQDLVAGHRYDTNPLMGARWELSLAILKWRSGLTAVETAIEAMEQIADTAAELDSWKLEARAIRQLAAAVMDAGDLRAAERLQWRLRSRLERFGDRPEALDCIYSLVAVIAGFSSGEEALRLAIRAAEMNRPELPLQTRYFAYFSAGTGFFVAGDLTSADQQYTSALNLVCDYHLWGVRSGLLNNYAVLLLETGRYGDALGMLSEGEEIARASNNGRMLSVLLANRAIALFEQQQMPEVARVAAELLALEDRYIPWWSRLAGISFRGLEALWRRDLHLVRECRVALNSIDIPNRRTNDLSYAEIFIARVAEHEGDVAGAVARLEQRISEYQDRDIFCRYRMELERARLLMQSRPQEAVAIAGRVRDHAARMSAQPLVRKADAILDRLL